LLSLALALSLALVPLALTLSPALVLLSLVLLSLALGLTSPLLAPILPLGLVSPGLALGLALLTLALALLALFALALALALRTLSLRLATLPLLLLALGFSPFLPLALRPLALFLAGAALGAALLLHSLGCCQERSGQERGGSRRHHQFVSHESEPPMLPVPPSLRLPRATNEPGLGSQKCGDLQPAESTGTPRWWPACRVTLLIEGDDGTRFSKQEIAGTLRHPENAGFGRAS